jgi:citrate lyase alpha subunit
MKPGTEVPGHPSQKPELGDKDIAVIKWVDGTVLDTVKQVNA